MRSLDPAQELMALLRHLRSAIESGNAPSDISVSFEAADFFTLTVAEGRSFDIIFDYTCVCSRQDVPLAHPPS